VQLSSLKFRIADSAGLRLCDRRAKPATGWLLQELRCATLLVNENGLARISLSEAVSLVGCGDACVRDPGHVNGDRISERDQMDH